MQTTVSKLYNTHPRLRLCYVRVMADNKVLRCRHGPLVAAVFRRELPVRVLVS
jgi:hypothetical protein